MRIALRAMAAASASELFSWWTDYGPDDSVTNRYMMAQRNILSRDGNTVTMEDTFTRPFKFVDRTVAHIIPPGRVEFESRSRIWNVRGTYTMTDEAGKARIDALIVLEPKGWWKIPLSLPPAKWRIRRAIEFDMQEHMRQFAEYIRSVGGETDGAHKGH